MLVLRAAALAGVDGLGAGGDGDRPSSGLAVGGAGHHGGVELGWADQAAWVTTCILGAGTDNRSVTLFGNPTPDNSNRRTATGSQTGRSILTNAGNIRCSSTPAED